MWKNRNNQSLRILQAMYGSGFGMQNRLSNILRSSCNRLKPRHSDSVTDAVSAQYSSLAAERSLTRKEISTVEDPFDSPTYNIPEKPVTFTEGASYSLVILAGLGIAGAAAYAVCKELIFEPKEYKIFKKAFERVQNDSQVRERIGPPVTPFGPGNHVPRRCVPHKIWTTDDGTEHVLVALPIYGPHGAASFISEMFKDKVDEEWKFMYLIVEAYSPSRAKLMLESYIPA